MPNNIIPGRRPAALVDLCISVLPCWLTLLRTPASYLRHSDKNAYLGPPSSVLAHLKHVGTSYASSKHVFPISRHHWTFKYRRDSFRDIMWYSKMFLLFAFFDQNYHILICCCPLFPSRSLFCLYLCLLLPSCKLQRRRPTTSAGVTPFQKWCVMSILAIYGLILHAIPHRTTPTPVTA